MILTLEDALAILDAFGRDKALRLNVFKTGDSCLFVKNDETGVVTQLSAEDKPVEEEPTRDWREDDYADGWMGGN